MKLSMKQSIFMKDGIDFTEICNATHCSKLDIAQTVRELGVKGKLVGELNGDFYKTDQDPKLVSAVLFEALDSKNILKKPN